MGNSRLALFLTATRSARFDDCWTAFAVDGNTPDLTVELTALDVIGYHLILPAVGMTKAGAGKATISWFPDNPGFALRETTNLTANNRVNCASGTNNPVTVTNTSVPIFYRIYHP